MDAIRRCTCADDASTVSAWGAPRNKKEQKQEILKDFQKKSTKCRDGWMDRDTAWLTKYTKESKFHNIATFYTTIPT